MLVCLPAGLFDGLRAPRVAPFCKAILSALRRSSGLMGLAMKSLAPFFMASTTLNGEDAPEIMMIGQFPTETADLLQRFDPIPARHDHIQHHGGNRNLVGVRRHARTSSPSCATSMAYPWHLRAVSR